MPQKQGAREYDKWVSDCLSMSSQNWENKES